MRTKRKTHPNKHVQAMSKYTLARLRKMQSLVDQQITFAFHAENTSALHKLQQRQKELQAAVMLKEFNEIL
jgi:hypothetical protein